MTAKELEQYLKETFSDAERAVLTDPNELDELHKYLENRVYLRARDVVIGGKKFRILPAALAGDIGLMLSQAEGVPGRKVDQETVKHLIKHATEICRDAFLGELVLLCTGWQKKDVLTNRKIVMGVRHDPFGNQDDFENVDVFHDSDAEPKFRVILLIED